MSSGGEWSSASRESVRPGVRVRAELEVVAVTVALSLLAACGARPSIRLCPCDEGYVCCEVDRVCVRSQAQCTPVQPPMDASTREDAEAFDAAPSLADAASDVDGGAQPDVPDLDQDRDGFLSIAAGGLDCDDHDRSVNPEATEIPYDAIDQDCSGADLVDVDGDGYIGIPAGGPDCDDGDASIWGSSTADHTSGDLFYFCRDQQISTWMAAESNCLGIGGHLVSIEDEATNEFVATSAKELLGPNSAWWIGLNDLANDRSFEWSDGRPVTYTKWGGSNPNHSPGEDCVIMYDLNGGTNTWHDQPCNYRLAPLSYGFGYACRVRRENRWTVLLEEDFDDGAANRWFPTSSGCALLGCPIVASQRLAMPGEWNLLVAPVVVPPTARQVAVSFVLERGENFGSYGGFGVAVLRTQPQCSGPQGAVAGELGADECGAAGTEVLSVDGLADAGSNRWRIEKTILTRRCEVFRDSVRVGEVPCGNWTSHAGHGGLLFEVRSDDLSRAAMSFIDDVKVEYR